MPTELRVLALTRYGRLGPSSRLRSFQFVPALQQCGISVSTAPLVADEKLARQLANGDYDLRKVARSYSSRVRRLLPPRDYDVLWIEKEMFPWLPGLLEGLPRLLRVPYLVDYDDATFHVYDQHSSRFVLSILGGSSRIS